jgi:nucleotide-binding universal stress UspA family protein
MSADVLLVPLDYTGCAWEVAAQAADLASRLGARVVLQYAVQLPTGVAAETAATPAGIPSLEALQRDAHDQLSALAQVFLEKRVDVRYRVDVGPPVEAILEAAREEAATMVVMGTHGRRGVIRFFLGSVAEQVIRRAPCPVLTVRASEGMQPHHTATQDAVDAQADG